MKKLGLFINLFFTLSLVFPSRFAVANNDEENIHIADKILENRLIETFADPLAKAVIEKLNEQNIFPREEDSSKSNFYFESSIDIKESSIKEDGRNEYVTIDSIPLSLYKKIIEKIISRKEFLSVDIDIELYKAALEASFKIGVTSYGDKSVKYNNQRNVKVSKEVYDRAINRNHSGLKRALDRFDELNKDRDNGILVFQNPQFVNINNDVRELLIIAVIYENLMYKTSVYETQAANAKEGEKAFNDRMIEIYGELSKIAYNKLQAGFEIIAMSVGDDKEFQYSMNTGVKGKFFKYTLGFRKRLVVSKLAKHFWIALFSRHQSETSYQRTYSNLHKLFGKYEREIAKKGKAARILETALAFVVPALVVGYGINPDIYPEVWEMYAEMATYPTTSFLEDYTPALSLHNIEKASTGTITGIISTGMYFGYKKLRKIFAKKDTFLASEPANRQALIRELVKELKAFNKEMVNKLDEQSDKGHLQKLSDKIKKAPIVKSLCAKLLTSKN